MIKLALAGLIALSSVMPWASRSTFPTYRTGMAHICNAYLNEVKAGRLAIEVVFDPAAPCTREGFIVVGQNGTMRLVDCGSYRKIAWLPPPTMGARCRH